MNRRNESTDWAMIQPRIVRISLGDRALPVDLSVTSALPLSWTCPNCGERVTACEHAVGEIQCAACGTWWVIHNVKLDA